MTQIDNIQVRRNTAAAAYSSNPTLNAGEVGFETDTNRVKIGDGSTAWNDLKYIGKTMPDGDVLANTDTWYQPLWDASDNTSITGLTGTYKWIGACLAPNGKIYCVPYSSASVLIIDPSTDTAETTSITGLTGAYKWVGACLAPNGKIYCVPYSSTSVLIVSPGFPTLPIAPLLSPYLNKF